MDRRKIKTQYKHIGDKETIGDSALRAVQEQLSFFHRSPQKDCG